ncbi:hypothetical protein [Thioclava sp.]|uniref:hypothetical protein n=1 Tax=Thioclava sp. TaxID=1933450 RepID=UPI00324220A4
MGQAKLGDLRRQHIEADLAKLTGHVANNRLMTWHGICGWAKATRAISADPSDGVAKRMVKNSDGFAPWTQADIQKFRQAWAIGTPQRLAMEPACCTAARASDSVRLGPGTVTKKRVAHLPAAEDRRRDFGAIQPSPAGIRRRDAG